MSILILIIGWWFINRFSKAFPNKKITVINVKESKTSGIRQDVIYNEKKLKVIEFYFKDDYKTYGWEGNSFGWKAALSCVHLYRRTV